MNDAEPPQPAGPEGKRDRRAASIVLPAFIILVVGGGLWMTNALLNQRAIDDCLAEGRRNCAPIAAPPR